ncbi:type II secretion system F family protein [Luteolibacter sp. AS25]|uniref:type II secretion system F family protein n=1 Tax=Luteolibacter sp. AS25 TaxID=3135776 RepID=UPI00398B33F8
MRLSPHNKRFFYEEMAKLLEAGFDIRKAADVLDTTRLPGSQRILLNNLRKGLEGGETIAESFGRNTQAISELERNIITAGERGGKLGRSFQHLADYFAMVASARSEMIKGMIYPVIILHMGVFVGTVPLAMMQGVKSKAEIAQSFVFTLLLIYVICFVLFLLGKMIWDAAPKSPQLDSLINRIPWIGKARRNMAMSRFCKVYHSCLLAGISMRETVRVSSRAAQSGLVRNAGVKLEAVAKEGNPLGPQFMREGAFPPEFSRSYATGEEAGTLDRDMANWSARFQEQAESTMKQASVMVPKILYFLMLIFIAWKIIGFFTGYYSALDGLLE